MILFKFHPQIVHRERSGATTASACPPTSSATPSSRAGTAATSPGARAGPETKVAFRPVTVPSSATTGAAGPTL